VQQAIISQTPSSGKPNGGEIGGVPVEAPTVKVTDASIVGAPVPSA
jgi:hypothetical protein